MVCFAGSWVITRCAVFLLWCLEACPLSACCEFVLDLLLSNTLTVSQEVVLLWLWKLCSDKHTDAMLWPALNPLISSSLLSIYCRSLHGNNISELHQGVFRDAASLSHLWVVPFSNSHLHLQHHASVCLTRIIWEQICQTCPGHVTPHNQVKKKKS